MPRRPPFATVRGGDQPPEDVPPDMPPPVAVPPDDIDPPEDIPPDDIDPPDDMPPDDMLPEPLAPVEPLVDDDEPRREWPERLCVDPLVPELIEPADVPDDMLPDDWPDMSPVIPEDGVAVPDAVVLPLIAPPDVCAMAPVPISAAPANIAIVK